jgi:outer membrane protein OmpA-like peptidoglycan-associated protein
VALVLLDHPELGQIELQGSASGEPDQTKPLSLARAEAVMVWLVDNGVSAQRLSARGYGSSLPTIVQTTDALDQVDIHILAPQSE